MPNQSRMGGGRQLASKVGHSAFVENPDIQDFLAECTYLREPNEDEREEILSAFQPVPETDGPAPTFVIAIDGSPYESNFQKGLPSTRAGFIKISGVAVHLGRYQVAADPTKRFVDPFAMAAIYEEKDALTFCLPSSNMNYGGSTSVKQGFRRKLFEDFRSHKTQVVKGRGATFYDTLFRLAEHHATDPTGSGESSAKWGKAGGDEFIRVHRCPSCGLKPSSGFQIPYSIGQQICGDMDEDGCDQPIYVTDVLRVHESVTTQGPNLEAISRTMNVLEAVFLAHLLLHLSKSSPRSLSEMCFVFDGPMALFGEAAWLHGGMLRLFHSIQADLQKRSLEPFLLFGLQKTGQVAEHGNMLQPYLADMGERILAISDEYRAEYVRQTDDSRKNFGDETYWGQDFLYHASNGDIFIVGIPYPFATKRLPDPTERLGAEENFRAEKAKIENYPTLGRTIDVIRAMRSDFYESSLVPVLAAHREASISLMPGGRVLDLMSLSAFVSSNDA